MNKQVILVGIPNCGKKRFVEENFNDHFDGYELRQPNMDTFFVGEMIEEISMEGFDHTAVVFLHIDEDICLRRDRILKEFSGNAIGEDAIKEYANQFNSVVEDYSDISGITVDATYHFKWVQEGSHVYNGSWVLDEKTK